MRILVTAHYSRAYKKLPAPIQKKAKDALQKLMKDISHPGLQVKRVKGTKNIFEARIDRSSRFTFEISDSVIILRNIGEHDKTLNNP